MVVSAQASDLLRGIGPGTPIGDLFRRYWHPVLLAGELSESGGRPVRVKILAEDLVAFRDSEGRVGLVDEACPHRGLPLSNAVNANGKLTCIYHSWAFDVTGRCVDDLPGADQVRLKAYPTIESAGLIWAYLGPPDKQPPPPRFIFNVLPADQVLATRAAVRRGYLQAIATQIEIAYPRAEYGDATVVVQNTAYGFRLMILRPAHGDNRQMEVACHVLPATTFVTSPEAGSGALLTVPVDTWSSLRFAVAFNGDRPFTATERDAIMRSGMMDPAQPPLLPGAQSDPGSDDPTAAGAGIARLQPMLIDCAEGLSKGIEPPGVNGADIALHAVCPRAVHIGPEDDPWRIAAGADEPVKQNKERTV